MYSFHALLLLVDCAKGDFLAKVKINNEPLQYFGFFGSCRGLRWAGEGGKGVEAGGEDGCWRKGMTGVDVRLVEL
jgi:hypothetical protein